MKFCLLVTVGLGIFIKEKNNILYLPWISPLSFFCAKGVYSVKLSGTKRYSINHFQTTQILQPPLPPRLFYFTQISDPPAY